VADHTLEETVQLYQDGQLGAQTAIKRAMQQGNLTRQQAEQRLRQPSGLTPPTNYQGGGLGHTYGGGKKGGPPPMNPNFRVRARGNPIDELGLYFNAGDVVKIGGKGGQEKRIQGIGRNPTNGFYQMFFTDGTMMVSRQADGRDMFTQITRYDGRKNMLNEVDKPAEGMPQLYRSEAFIRTIKDDPAYRSLFKNGRFIGYPKDAKVYRGPGELPPGYEAPPAPPGTEAPEDEYKFDFNQGNPYAQTTSPGINFPAPFVPPPGSNIAGAQPGPGPAPGAPAPGAPAPGAGGMPDVVHEPRPGYQFEGYGPEGRPIYRRQGGPAAPAPAAPMMPMGPPTGPGAPPMNQARAGMNQMMGPEVEAGTGRMAGGPNQRPPNYMPMNTPMGMQRSGPGMMDRRMGGMQRSGPGMMDSPGRYEGGTLSMGRGGQLRPYMPPPPPQQQPQGQGAMPMGGDMGGYAPPVSSSYKVNARGMRPGQLGLNPGDMVMVTPGNGTELFVNAAYGRTGGYGSGGQAGNTGPGMRRVQGTGYSPGGVAQVFFTDGTILQDRGDRRGGSNIMRAAVKTGGGMGNQYMPPMGGGQNMPNQYMPPAGGYQAPAGRYGGGGRGRQGGGRYPGLEGDPKNYQTQRYSPEGGRNILEGGTGSDIVMIPGAAQVANDFAMGRIGHRQAYDRLNSIGHRAGSSRALLYYRQATGQLPPADATGEGGIEALGLQRQGGGPTETTGNLPERAGFNAATRAGGATGPAPADAAGSPNPGGILPITLGSVFGPETAAQAQYSTFLDRLGSNMQGQPGGATWMNPAYRGALEERQPLATAAFNLQRVLDPNPPVDFGAFLNQLGTGQGVMEGFTNLDPVFGGLGQAANMLRAGPNAPNLSLTQQGAIQALGGDPVTQFGLARIPQAFGVPDDLRSGLLDLQQQRFDRTLSDQGLAPGFQFLPFAQRNPIGFF
jgi:hypothetical protein